MIHILHFTSFFSGLRTFPIIWSIMFLHWNSYLYWDLFHRWCFPWRSRYRFFATDGRFWSWHCWRLNLRLRLWWFGGLSRWRPIFSCWLFDYWLLFEWFMLFFIWIVNWNIKRNLYKFLIAFLNSVSRTQTNSDLLS